jgi:hypothetical protein
MFKNWLNSINLEKSDQLNSLYNNMNFNSTNPFNYCRGKDIFEFITIINNYFRPNHQIDRKKLFKIIVEAINICALKNTIMIFKINRLVSAIPT